MNLKEKLGILAIILGIVAIVTFNALDKEPVKVESPTEMFKLGAEMYRAQLLIKADSSVNISELDSMFIEEVKEINDTLANTMKMELTEL